MFAGACAIFVNSGQLARDMTAAWDAGDADAVLAMMTEDAVKRCPRATFRADGEGAGSIAADVE